AINHVLFSTKGGFGVKCYGITKDPNSEEYILILEYMRGGDFNALLNICNGCRPQEISGLPPEYEFIMKKCWDADPVKRPSAAELLHYFDNKLDQINHENTLLNFKFSTPLLSNNCKSVSFDHKNLPVPKNL
ncbi:8770_t:CDS:2, partial [Racocetra persica]